MSSSVPTKRCTKCGEVKPLDTFYRARGGRFGRRGDCIACNSAAAKKRYEADPEGHIERVKRWQRENKEKYQAKQRRWREQNREVLRRHDRERHLQKAFGIALADYERMLDEQGGGCAICGAPEPEGSSLHVDHDHDTGEVRALLCFPCNNALGLLEEDEERVRTLLEYLHDPGPVRTRVAEQVAAIRERAASLTREASV